MFHSESVDSIPNEQGPSFGLLCLFAQSNAPILPGELQRHT